MADRLPPRPDFERAYRVVGEVYNGNASQERANVIRATLDTARNYIACVVEREERAIGPQVLLDVNAIFTALKEAGIAGTVAMLVEPPGPALPGQYSVETRFGKLTGEAAQLAETITLLGRALATRRVEGVAEATERFRDGPEAWIPRDGDAGLTEEGGTT